MRSPIRLLATLRNYNKQVDLADWLSSEMTQNLKAIEDAFRNLSIWLGTFGPNEVGSYAFLLYSGADPVQAGVEVSGDLVYSDTNKTIGAAASGTWRAMGSVVNNEVTLFLKVRGD